MPPCRASGRNQAPGGAHPGGATRVRARSRGNESCAKPVRVRSGEANSYLAPRACLRPVAGGSLRPPPVLDADGRAPAARARGSIATTRIPAVPGRGIGRRSRALDPSVTCRRGSLPPAAFPECSGSGPWRVDAQAWQNRTSINRQRALLTAPVPHWQAEAPRPDGNRFLDARRAPDRAVGKPETSRNGHTVPDRRACLSGD